MTKEKARWIWSVFVIVVGVLVVSLVWTYILADARTPYSVTVQLDRDFEKNVQEKFPSAKFLHLPENVKFTEVWAPDDNEEWSYHSPLMILASPELFMTYLEPNDSILVLLNRERDGVGRYYAKLDVTGKFPTYKELVQKPKEASFIKLISHEKIVFEKDTSTFILIYTLGGTFSAWIFGLMIISLRYQRDNSNTPVKNDR